MSEFDARARDWDNNPVHWERSEAIAKSFLEMVPVNPGMKAMEYGAGTGILSFLLSGKFSEITLMDNSEEMVKVMHEKVMHSKLKNLKPLLFDLEHSDYYARTFDCIFSQMVLHHVADIEQLLNKFHQILNPGGYLAIADLYAEDGSFHGEGFNGHNGFDVKQLSKTLEKHQFTNIYHKQSFTLERENGNAYPIFLMVALKQAAKI